jgi:hypothetical protein
MAMIEALHMPARIAVTDDGALLEIVNLYDGEGRATDDPAKALAFVAGPNDDQLYFHGLVEDYPQVVLH